MSLDQLNMLHSVRDEKSRMFDSLVKKRNDVQRLMSAVKLEMVLQEQVILQQTLLPN